MKNINEAIGLGFILGVIHGLLQPAYSVPVVPNFTREHDLNRDHIKSHWNNQFNGLQYWISVHSDWKWY